MQAAVRGCIYHLGCPFTPYLEKEQVPCFNIALLILRASNNNQHMIRMQCFPGAELELLSLFCRDREGS